MRNENETNLYDETVMILRLHRKNLEDVKWVGSKYVYTTWEQFAELAKKTIYDNGFGGAEVATDLKVVGTNWWLERHEYDGSEWWELKELPQKPERQMELVALCGRQSINEDGYSADLLGMNTKSEEDTYDTDEI